MCERGVVAVIASHFLNHDSDSSISGSAFSHFSLKRSILLNLQYRLGFNPLSKQLSSEIFYTKVLLDWGLWHFCPLVTKTKDQRKLDKTLDKGFVTCTNLTVL